MMPGRDERDPFAEMHAALGPDAAEKLSKAERELRSKDVQGECHVCGRDSLRHQRLSTIVKLTNENDLLTAENATLKAEVKRLRGNRHAAKSLASGIDLVVQGINHGSDLRLQLEGPVDEIVKVLSEDTFDPAAVDTSGMTTVSEPRKVSEVDLAKRDLLRMAMSNISESAWCAGWMMGLGTDLWKITFEGGSREFGQIEVSDRDVEILRWLHEECGGWFDDDKEFCSAEEWERRRAPERP